MYVSDNYKRLLEQIEKAGNSKIQLVVVTKGHSWEEVRPLYDAGCRHFGENRIQEALPKMDHAPSDIQWHYVGTIQSNKVRKIVDSFALVHSVDTFEIAEKIDKAGQEEGVVTPILLEVNTSGEPRKHGLSEVAWESFMELINTLKHVRIEGLMTMAPLTDDQEAIRSCFSHLRQMRDRLKRQLSRHPFHHLSMGMSHDYQIAIEEGATLLRIGTAVFQTN